MNLFNAWYLTRAAGITSYVLLSLSVLTGLYGLVRKKNGQSPGLFSLAHVSLANWSMFIAMFHVAILLFDSYVRLKWKDLFVPFASSYHTIPMSIGIIGFYFLVITIVTTELRTKIGLKIWRKLHMLSPLLYVMVTIHGIWMGTDTQSVGVFSMYLVSVFGVLVMLYLRFRRPSRVVYSA